MKIKPIVSMNKNYTNPIPCSKCSDQDSGLILKGVGLHEVQTGSCMTKMNTWGFWRPSVPFQPGKDSHWSSSKATVISLPGDWWKLILEEKPWLLLSSARPACHHPCTVVWFLCVHTTWVFFWTDHIWWVILEVLLDDFYCKFIVPAISNDTVPCTEESMNEFWIFLIYSTSIYINYVHKNLDITCMHACLQLYITESSWVL